jgi:transposase
MARKIEDRRKKSLKRDGKVLVDMVLNCSREELLPIIRGQTLERSMVHTDSGRACDDLVLNDYDHFRDFHKFNKCARRTSQIGGIGTVRRFAKKLLDQFNGMKDGRFLLDLKECEFKEKTITFSEFEFLWLKQKCQSGASFTRSNLCNGCASV